MSDLKELMLRSPKLTLSVAESLTCGRLQALIGATSGASEFFLGGVTAYTLDEKVNLLGVSLTEARTVNCVSAGVAEQMARGACRLFGADVAAATTGYAEPSAEWRVEAPFAWWALARLQPTGGFAMASGRVDCPGLSRTAVQERAARAAYDALVGWVRAPAAARTP
jgi:nicotinamide-nucleotide amidase